MALYGYSKARCNFPSAEAVPAIQRSGGRIPIGQRTRVAAGADAVQKKARGSDGFAGANSPAPLASLLAIRARLSAIATAAAVWMSPAFPIGSSAEAARRCLSQKFNPDLVESLTHDTRLWGRFSTRSRQ